MVAEAVYKKQESSTKKTYSLIEYLELEERSQVKHEYHQGQIVRMPGGKAKHSEIATNIATAIKWSLKPLPKKFRVYNSDLKIYIEAKNKSVYPDALVICEEPLYWNGREDLIVNPLLIVEVASKSTKTYDRGDKFLLYEMLPSFKEYLLVEQDKAHVETWFRESDELWRKTIVSENIDQNVLLRSLGISINLSEIYENISFK